jgi:hypothetical protein
MIEVRILKAVGPWRPGELVTVEPMLAREICDGVRGMLEIDFEKRSKVARDPANLTVKEMQEMDIKNTPQDEVAMKHAEIEKKAVEGKPVASGEPLVPTGGVTPPTQVFPAHAEVAKVETTKPEEIKVKKAEDKKLDQKDKKIDKK